MVSDFRAVKDVGINDFLDSFDHAVLLWNKDVRAPIIKKINPARHILVPFNPTAEMMAKSFFVVCDAILSSGPKLSGERDVRVEKVMVHETDTGYALCRREDLDADSFPDISFKQWKFSEGIKAEWKSKEWYRFSRGHLSASSHL
jgi:6-pyruvoyltetrahydropterin/6-carboxytetrahydropterin synthase